MSITAAMLVVPLSACTPPFHGVNISGAQPASQLNLPDVIDGKIRTLDEFKDQVVVVFFGYMHCPDVCPMTLAELREVKEKLGPTGDKLQVIFVTLDPERDQPELLKTYVQSFDPSFIALRGSPAETARITKEFKVFYAKVVNPDSKEAHNYTIDHTAGAYVIDKTGRLRLFERFGTKPEHWIQDIQGL